MMDYKFGDCEEGDKGGSRHGCRNTHKKCNVIARTHAVVQPLAVMVEMLHALVARAAVFRTWPGN